MKNKKKKTKTQEDQQEKRLDTSTSLLCPICQQPLSSAIVSNVEVDYCPICLGMWFERDELRWAKDEKDEELRWLDIDLWKDEENFKIARGIRLCPYCRVPLYEVYYGDSKIVVDVCNLCHGVWLDRAEFKKIIDYLKRKKDYEILHNYAKNVFRQFAEIFVGPEPIKEEVLDFISLLKVLNYKFLVNHQIISKLILRLPK